MTSAVPNKILRSSPPPPPRPLPSKKNLPQTEAIVTIAAGILAIGLGYTLYKNWDEIIPSFNPIDLSNLPNITNECLPFNETLPVINDTISHNSSLDIDESFPINDACPINENEIEKSVITEAFNRVFDWIKPKPVSLPRGLFALLRLSIVVAIVYKDRKEPGSVIKFFRQFEEGIPG